MSQSLLRHTLAVLIHEAQAVLRDGIALLGGFAIPSSGLLIVPCHAFAELRHHAVVCAQHRPTSAKGVR